MYIFICLWATYIIARKYFDANIKYQGFSCTKCKSKGKTNIVRHSYDVKNKLEAHHMWVKPLKRLRNGFAWELNRFSATSRPSYIPWANTRYHSGRSSGWWTMNEICILFALTQSESRTTRLMNLTDVRKFGEWICMNYANSTTHPQQNRIGLWC